MVALRNGWRAMAGACLALVLAGSASAETLYDAMALAYDTNPALRAQRAAVRAVDEGYVQARSQYGPTLSFSGQAGYQIARLDQQALVSIGAGDLYATTGTADLSLTQPLYTGGRVKAQTDSAAADIFVNREMLRQTEVQMLQNVVTAYMDVRRDHQEFDIVRAEIDALGREVEEVRAKGRLGDVTRTDVAQAEARWLSARAQLALYQGRLQISGAEYLNVVGRNPGELAPEPDLPGLPTEVEQAFNAGEANNPQLLQAIQTEKGARAQVAEARAANMPTVSVRVDLAVGPIAPYDRHDYDKSATAAVVLNQPIFASGMNSSKIREALERDNRAALDIETARRNMVQAVAQAWDQLTSSRVALEIEQRQYDAEAVAVQGNRVEERAGTRQVIDLLNAEQELANTRITLAQDRHDEYVARAALLAAMGVLQADLIVPDLAPYKPQTSLKRAMRRVSVPWTGAVQALDGVAAPGASRPQVSDPAAGGTTPVYRSSAPAPPVKPAA